MQLNKTRHERVGGCMSCFVFSCGKSHCLPYYSRHGSNTWECFFILHNACHDKTPDPSQYTYSDFLGVYTLFKLNSLEKIRVGRYWHDKYVFPGTRVSLFYCRSTTRAELSVFSISTIILHASPLLRCLATPTIVFPFTNPASVTCTLTI